MDSQEISSSGWLDPPQDSQRFISRIKACHIEVLSGIFERAAVKAEGSLGQSIALTNPGLQAEIQAYMRRVAAKLRAMQLQLALSDNDTMDTIRDEVTQFIFLKGDLTISDKDLLSSSTSVGYDQGNQVTADATMVQQAIAKLKGELPADG